MLSVEWMAPTSMLTPTQQYPIVMPSMTTMERSPPTLLQHAISKCHSFIFKVWEGSVADSQMFHDACFTDFRIPVGKYYLTDAGFPACDALLVPYHGVQYHLAEWGCANSR